MVRDQFDVELIGYIRREICGSEKVPITAILVLIYGWGVEGHYCIHTLLLKKVEDVYLFR